MEIVLGDCSSNYGTHRLDFDAGLPCSVGETVGLASQLVSVEAGIEFAISHQDRSHAVKPKRRRDYHQDKTLDGQAESSKKTKSLLSIKKK